MKHLKSLLGLAALTAVLGTSVVSSNVLAWGDSAGGRQTYTIDQINKGAIDNKIVLNSISDNPTVGNELYFVQARAESDSNNSWNANALTVEDGKTYVVRMYVHNNNRFGKDMVAKNVKASFIIPTNSAKELSINGVVSSSNATPSKVWDDVVFKSENTFHLEYISGTAHIGSNGKANGALSDKLVNGGTLIGYDALDGQIPGCFEYSAFISFKVKVVYDYDFTIEKKVRVIGGEENWFDEVRAKVGDTVEYKITYKNTSNSTEKDVQIIELLGSDLKYIAGTTKLYNSNHKNGITLSSDDLTKTGINIGDYAPGAGAVILFRAKVVDKNLGCGADNVLRSWTQGYIGKNNTMKQDYADVLVHPACPEKPVEPEKPPVEPETPPVLPETGPTAVAATVLGAGSLTTAAGAFITSRKKRF
ncbi:DUF11 domain-containing protein [Candidatus Saccharibacteria bacterium]|nr:DUF11 domain-containing protein [Candidatus Saccharibacteria bacterium]